MEKNDSSYSVSIHKYLFPSEEYIEPTEPIPEEYKHILFFGCKKESFAIYFRQNDWERIGLISNLVKEHLDEQIVEIDALFEHTKSYVIFNYCHAWFKKGVCKEAFAHIKPWYTILKIRNEISFEEYVKEIQYYLMTELDPNYSRLGEKEEIIALLNSCFVFEGINDNNQSTRTLSPLLQIKEKKLILSNLSLEDLTKKSQGELDEEYKKFYNVTTTLRHEYIGRWFTNVLTSLMKPIFLSYILPDNMDFLNTYHNLLLDKLKEEKKDTFIPYNQLNIC